MHHPTADFRVDDFLTSQDGPDTSTPQQLNSDLRQHDLSHEQSFVSFGHDVSSRQEPVNYDISRPVTATGPGMSFADDFLFFPDMSYLNQDLDFGLWDFDMDSIAFPAVMTGPLTAGSTEATLSNGQPPGTRNLARGYAAFKRSPWLWTPTEHNSTTAEMQVPEIDDVSIDTIGMTPEQRTTIMSPLIDATARDKMYALVVRLSPGGPPAKSPPFPSVEILNHLAQAFVVKEEYQVDSWIHFATLDVRTVRSDLLLAIVAAGSTLFAIPAIRKMGLALQEVVRNSCATTVSYILQQNCHSILGRFILPAADIFMQWEYSNEATRDLETLQAFALNLDIGIWSGYKRKMEIAESFGLPPITVSANKLLSTPLT